LGTPDYMSPEQLEGSVDVDERTDIWSVGVVAYVCLTGRPPFSGETFRELCLAIYCGTFTPATALRGALPQAIDAWFEEALASERNRRFGSVAAMSKAFELAATRKNRDTGRALQRRRRHGWPATIACAAVGAGLGIAVAGLVASPTTTHAASSPETAPSNGVAVAVAPDADASR
jgi:serine/threonine protein kinase